MLNWIITLLLNAILTRLIRAASSLEQDAVKKIKEGKTDDANVKAYNEAKDRAEKVKAALDLLNGTKSS